MPLVTLDLPEDTLAAARRLADEGGVTLDEVLAEAVDGLVESRRQRAYLKERAERGRSVDIRAIMAKVPDVPPVPGDELE